MRLYDNLIKWLAGFFCALYRIEVIGAENIPEDTEKNQLPGFMLCSNHIANLDPVVIIAAIRIKINWMAKESLFKIPGLAQLVRQILRDADAGLAVLDPELAGLLVGGGQGQRIALGMGEEGGVEVTAHISFLAEVHPLLEVLGLQLVTVDPAAVFLHQIPYRQITGGGQHFSVVIIGKIPVDAAKSCNIITLVKNGRNHQNSFKFY